MLSIDALTVAIYGESGTGKTSLAHRYVHGIYPAPAGSPRGQVGSRPRSIIGQPMQIAVDDSGDDTLKPDVSGVVIVYDVNDTSSPGHVQQILDDVVQNNDVIVGVVGNKIDVATGGTGWVDVVQRVSALKGVSLHMVASAATGENVDLFFDSMGLTYVTTHSEVVKISQVFDYLRLLPRVVKHNGGVNMAETMYAYLQLQRGLAVDPPVVFVATDLGDVEKIVKNSRLISPSVIDNLLIWIPHSGLQGGTKSKAFRAFINKKDKQGHIFYHTNKSHSGDPHSAATRWLGDNLKIGWVTVPKEDFPVAGDGASPEFIHNVISTLAPLVPGQPFAARRRLALYKDHKEFTEGQRAASYNVFLAQNFMRGVNAWIYNYQNIHALWDELPAFDMGYVGQLKDIPKQSDYDLTTLKNLGDGGFGCVFSVKMTGRKTAIAIKVGPVNADVDPPQTIPQKVAAAKKEPALLELINSNNARVTPYVARTFRTYITSVTVPPPLAGKKGNRAPPTTRAAMLVDAVIKTKCKMLTWDNVNLGLVVVEMPLYDLGPIHKVEEVDESTRRVWMFQLFHGLAAMNRTIGFVHADIKPDNILVRTRKRKERVKALHVRTADTYTNRDLTGPIDTTAGIWHDSALTEAVLVDYGLSVAERVPIFDYYSNGEPAHTFHGVGTVGFFDPALGTYFDPRLTKEEIDARFRQPHAARSVGSDVWSLGILAMMMWAKDPIVVPNPMNDKEDWQFDDPTGIVQNELPESWTAFRKGVLGSIPRRELAGFIDGDRDGAYIDGFVHALLMFKAFNDGKAPAADVPADEGPYFKYFIDRWTDIGNLSPVVDKGGVPVYDYIANHIRLKEPYVYDFIQKCLTWSPIERAKFLTEGGVFSSDMFKIADGLEWIGNQPLVSGPKTDTYHLDLYPRDPVSFQ